MGADHEHVHNDYELHDHHHGHDHHDHDHHGHDHHDHVHGGDDMGVHVGHKAAALCVMAVATLIASFAPIYIRKKINKKSNSKRSEMFLTGLLCCGAGVLLATVFLHILPETSHSIRDAMNGGFISEIEFPITELLLCCGFFLIYLIEEVVHNCLGHSHNNSDATSVSTISIKNISTVEDGMSRNDTTNVKENNKSSGFYNNGFQEEFEQDSNQAPTSNNNISSHSHSTLIKADSSVLKAVFVVAAISVHSIMEGIAIGVEEHVMDMWLLMGAICMHKLIIAFSIGMELLQEGVKRIPFFAAMIIFSLASPLGGVIGTLSFSAKVKTTAGIMVNAVLQGLAGGSILYIIFCEILERERARQKGGYIIVITLMLGFGLMCGVQLIPGHSHSH